MKSILGHSILILFLACIVANAMAGFGPCPAAPYEHDDFNATKFRGLWYLYSTSHGYYDAFRNECRTDLIMSKTNQTTELDFKIYTSAFDKETNRTQRYNRQFICESENDPKCAIYNEGGFFPTSVTVMRTDHFGYAIMQV